MKKYKTVQEVLDDLSDETRSQVEELRRIIQDAEPGLTEHVKWNAPSYVFEGEDRITFNLHGQQVRLVFPAVLREKKIKKQRRF